jgi:hypothetical protein
MRTAASTLLGLAVVVSLAACGGQQAAPATGPGGPAAASPLRAQAGDTVYLVDHYVRPDQREQFEGFVEQVLWPALRGRVQQQTRMLKSTVPNEEGSFTYTFVLDPVVQGERYNILDFLRAAYPEDEAVQHYVRFTDTWAREFTTRLFVQSR